MKNSVDSFQTQDLQGITFLNWKNEIPVIKKKIKYPIC